MGRERAEKFCGNEEEEIIAGTEEQEQKATAARIEASLLLYIAMADGGLPLREQPPFYVILAQEYQLHHSARWFLR